MQFLYIFFFKQVVGFSQFNKLCKQKKNKNKADSNINSWVAFTTKEAFGGLCIAPPPLSRGILRLPPSTFLLLLT